MEIKNECAKLILRIASIAYLHSETHFGTLLLSQGTHLSVSGLNCI